MYTSPVNGVFFFSRTKWAGQDKLQKTKPRGDQPKQRFICQFFAKRGNVIQTSGSSFGSKCIWNWLENVYRQKTWSSKWGLPQRMTTTYLVDSKPTWMTFATRWSNSYWFWSNGPSTFQLSPNCSSTTRYCVDNGCSCSCLEIIMSGGVIESSRWWTPSSRSGQTFYAPEGRSIARE